MLIGNTNEVLIPYFVFTTPSHQPHHTEPLILVGMQLAVTTDQVRSPCDAVDNDNGDALRENAVDGDAVDD